MVARHTPVPLLEALLRWRESMDLNASPAPEDDEVFPEPQSEEDNAPDEYNKHINMANDPKVNIIKVDFFFVCIFFSGKLEHDYQDPFFGVPIQDKLGTSRDVFGREAEVENPS